MIKTILSALTAATVMTGAANASIVQNGSFEQSPGVPGIRNNAQIFENLNSGPGASWQIWKSLPGWTTTSGAGIEIQSNRTLGSIDAQHGQHYVELDSNNNSSMLQTVTLAVGAYSLDFYYSPRTSNAATNGVSWSLDGLTSGTVTNGTAGATVGNWSKITSVFNVAAAGTYSLIFSAEGISESYGGLIGNVAINGAPNPGPAPVPVPAASILLLSAAGALAALRSKAKAKA